MKRGEINQTDFHAKVGRLLQILKRLTEYDFYEKVARRAAEADTQDTIEPTPPETPQG